MDIRVLMHIGQPRERVPGLRAIQASAGGSENPISTIKNFVCKHLC